MKKKSTSQSAFFNARALIGLFLSFAGVRIALFAFGAPTERFQPQGARQQSNKAQPVVAKMMGPVSHDLDLVPLGAFQFHDTGTLNTARQQHTATLLPNGMVLVAGGFPSASAGRSAELYDPASGSWTATGNLNTARAIHTATLLPNGMVLVAGGTSVGVLASAELYDPATGSWTATASLNTARQQHTATLLPDGMVLVAGGHDGSLNAVPSAELYDPASGTWTGTGDLNAPRWLHTATLLASGNVLVAGGT